METIVFVLVILALAGGAIWYYNRTNPGADVNGDGRVDLDDAAQALRNTRDGLAQDTRDMRDAVLAQASESAARAQALIDSKRAAATKAGKKSAAAPKKAAPKSTANKKPATDKKPAVRAKTAGTGRSRATKKSS